MDRLLDPPRGSHADLVKAMKAMLEDGQVSIDMLVALLGDPRLVDRNHVPDPAQLGGGLHVLLDVLTSSHVAEAVPQIERLLKNPDEEISELAARAIGRIAVSSAEPIARNILAENNPDKVRLLLLGMEDVARENEQLPWSDAMFDELLNRVENEDIEETASALFAIDRERTRITLFSPEYISTSNPAAWNLLFCCVRVNELPPLDLLWSLIRDDTVSDEALGLAIMCLAMQKDVGIISFIENIAGSSSSVNSEDVIVECVRDLRFLDDTPELRSALSRLEDHRDPEIRAAVHFVQSFLKNQ